MNARIRNRRSLSRRIALLTLLPGAAASAQSFVGIPLAPGMHEMRPVGIAMSAAGPVIPHRAISEKGVQLVQSPGVFAYGRYYDAPSPVGPTGLYQDVENVMFRSIPAPGRAEVIPGVDIIVKKTPGGKAGVWDTRESNEGSLFDLPDSLGAESWPNSVNANGSVITGAVHGSVPGVGATRRAVQWRNFGAAELLPVPGGTLASEAWDVSPDGLVAVGGISRQATPGSEPKWRPTAGSDADGIIWHPGGFTVVDRSVAGSSANSLVLTGLSGDGGKAFAAISTTRSNAKGGMYTVSTGEWELLDDGNPDHESVLLAMSADASVVGGSISILPGQEIAALWLLGSGGTYEYHDASTLLLGRGATDLSGWQLRAVTGVTPDGSMIAGWGINPAGQTTGWYATIPAPGSLGLLGAVGLLAARRRRS